jgi:hypothetical protein
MTTPFWFDDADEACYVLGDSRLRGPNGGT